MPWWVVLALFVVSYALSAIMAPKNNQKPAGLDEFDFPQVDEGTPKSIVFGDAWDAGGFVPWYGNLRTKKIKQKKK